MVLPREEQINSSASWAALKLCIQITLYGHISLCLGIYAHKYIYMHVITISKRRGHAYESEQGRACARVWRKKRKGEI